MGLSVINDAAPIIGLGAPPFMYSPKEGKVVQESQEMNQCPRNVSWVETPASNRWSKPAAVSYVSKVGLFHRPTGWVVLIQGVLDGLLLGKIAILRNRLDVL